MYHDLAPLCSWKGVLCDPQDDSVIAIELENVALKATIPSELGALSTLKALVLRKNQIYGTIPSQIAVLPKLEILDLSDNRITGTIPEFKSPKLIDLSLGFNRLTGTLPSDFGHGHELLVEMDIAWNKLTGIIPDSIGEMKGLNKLILSGNDLYGKISSHKPVKILTLPLFSDNRPSPFQHKIASDYLSPD